MQRTFQRLFLAAALPFALPALAQQSYVWTGATSNDWNTASNWNPNGIPGRGCNSSGACDTAIFGASARTQVNVADGNNVLFVSIVFTPAAPAYTLNVTGVLSLVNGLVNKSGSTHPTFVVAGGEMNVLGGTLANSIVINASALSFITPAADEAASVTMQPTGLLFIAGYDPTLAKTVTLGSLSGAGNAYMASFELVLGQLGRNDVFSGVIADGGGDGIGIDGSGAALTKVGTGSLQLTGNDTYTGKTTVQQGMLEVDGSLASPEVLVMTGARLAGTGTLAGTLVAQGGSTIIPGTWESPFSPPPNTALTAGRLFCAASPTIYTRIGNVGSDTHGNYLVLNAPLQHAFCSHLHFSLASAGLPLTVGSYYLLVAIQGSTDYGPGNVDFDFDHFTGYTQATGNIVVTNLAGVSAIYLQLTGLGDAIFHNGFE